MPAERLQCQVHFCIPAGRRDTDRQRRHGTVRVASKRDSFPVFYGRKETETTSNL